MGAQKTIPAIGNTLGFFLSAGSVVYALGEFLWHPCCLFKETSKIAKIANTILIVETRNYVSTLVPEDQHDPRERLFAKLLIASTVHFLECVSWSLSSHPRAACFIITPTVFCVLSPGPKKGISACVAIYLSIWAFLSILEAIKDGTVLFEAVKNNVDDAASFVTALCLIRSVSIFPQDSTLEVESCCASLIVYLLIKNFVSIHPVVSIIGCAVTVRDNLQNRRGRFVENIS